MRISTPYQALNRTPKWYLPPTLSPVGRCPLRSRRRGRRILARQPSLHPGRLRPGRSKLHQRYLHISILTMSTGLGRFFLTRSEGQCGRFRLRGRAAGSCTRISASYTRTIGSPILLDPISPSFGSLCNKWCGNALIDSVLSLSYSAQTRQRLGV